MDIQKALSAPEAYPEQPRTVTVIQTHISWVFLTGEHAYKVKKPVNFGFLDFSTLEKRKLYCLKELELNRQLSPDIYLGVLPVTEKNGIVRIGGRGKVIDYAVKMRQLPQESLMSNLLGKRTVDKKEIGRIVDILARFYAGAESGKEISKHGSQETIKFNWDENFSQTREFIGKTVSGKDFDEIKKRVENFMEKNKKLFERRVAEGKIKRCHGDLHSGNIFLDSGVHIFDCIEFNDRFACSDIASDVAFLSMDLEFRGRGDLSEYFLKKYIEKTGDSEIRKLIDFYRCYRAYVRGKVISFRINDTGISEKERNEAEKAASKYFLKALGYSRKL